MTFQRPAIIEEMRRDIRKNSIEENVLRAQLERDPKNDLFRIKAADQWLKDEYGKPDARQLLGALWHEQELCILFADTNVGKSILAVQIGYSLGKRVSIHPFGNGAANVPQKVLYIDFELSAAQFKARYYHRNHGLLHFGEYFIRAEFNAAGDNPLLYDDYHQYVKQNIENAIVQTKANVVIIDNISSMGSETGHAAAALPLMKALKALKTRYCLSMLVLAHTPKRNMRNPITENDLQGSKMLINFADSAFAIGRSNTDHTLRYLKQIKQRNTALTYGAEHVALFSISQNLNFLEFGFLGFDNEYNHLQKLNGALSDQIKARIIELGRLNLPHQHIADHLMISKTSVHRVLAKLNKEKAGEE